MNRHCRRALGQATLSLLLASSAAAAPKPTPAEAKAFIAQVDRDLRVHKARVETAEWIKSTYITDDTERNAASAQADLMAFLGKAIKDSTRFAGVKADPDTQRMISLLRFSSALPSPRDAAKRTELASLLSRMEGLYGKGKWCGADGKAKCRDLEQLSEVIAESRRYDELLEAWVGWHSISREIRPLYRRFVELGNEGAREIGFADLGALWRSSYELAPADFEKEADRLWTQVKPLYEDLHCYVRGRLARYYGQDKVRPDGPIPAHLLGDMWAQEWRNIYPLVEPYPGLGSLDVTKALQDQKYDELKMVKLGESFFTSLGFAPLPASFWQRSMFRKPLEREVVCHASAWDVTYDGDLRIKMCIKTKEDDLTTIHHELGHVFYFQAYERQPAVLYQNGANDGFHEAVGDAIALSVNPRYLQKVGILGEPSADPRAEINVLLKDALERVAFLPFGKLMDEWRWEVLSGKVDPSRYNAAWWDLRRKLQGISAPVERTEADFDPGAKYHIAANVPYVRYFLARILQFQFHRALCQTAGHKGPLNACSIHGSKEAGAKLSAMLQLGASRPWPEALQALTGQSQMDATAIVDYFAPLQTWLKEQNRGQKCGW